MKAPYIEDVIKVGNYDAAAIGVPFDGGTIYRPGECVFWSVLLVDRLQIFKVFVGHLAEPNEVGIFGGRDRHQSHSDILEKNQGRYAVVDEHRGMEKRISGKLDEHQVDDIALSLRDLFARCGHGRF